MLQAWMIHGYQDWCLSPASSSLSHPSSVTIGCTTSSLQEKHMMTRYTLNCFPCFTFQEGDIRKIPIRDRTVINLNIADGNANMDLKTSS